MVRKTFEPDILTIQLRDGTLAVRIHGIPFDLTKAEAEKIAAVVLALGSPVTHTHSGEPG